MLRRAVLLIVRLVEILLVSFGLWMIIYAIIYHSVVLGMYAVAALAGGLALELIGVFLFESPRLKQGFKR